MCAAALAAYGGRSHNSCEHFRARVQHAPLGHFTTGKPALGAGNAKTTPKLEKDSSQPSGVCVSTPGRGTLPYQLGRTARSRKRLDLAESRQHSVSGYCCGADNRARRRSPRRVCFQRQCFSCLGTTTSAIRCRCPAHVSTGSRHAHYVGRCLVKRRQQCNTASAPACARRCRQELGAHRRAEKEASGSQPGARRRLPSLRAARSRVRSTGRTAGSGRQRPGAPVVVVHVGPVSAAVPPLLYSSPTMQCG